MTASTTWNDYPLAIVDVETTGLDPENDRVIEIAIVHMRAGKVEDVFTSLVDPARELPPEAASITGITAEELVGKPSFSDLAEELQRRLEGRAFVAYNVAFDRAFITAEFARADVDWTPAPCIDPLVFVRELHRNEGSKRLEAVCARMGIELEGAHRAHNDAEATGHVLYGLASQLPTELDDLVLLQQQWAQQQDNEMAGWRNRRGSSFESGASALGAAERGNALGPAYIYGEDTDPIRAMFVHLPDSGSRR